MLWNIELAHGKIDAHKYSTFPHSEQKPPQRAGAEVAPPPRTAAAGFDPNPTDAPSGGEYLPEDVQRDATPAERREANAQVARLREQLRQRTKELSASGEQCGSAVGGWANVRSAMAPAQAQLEARKPAEQDRGRVAARAPLEAKRRGYFSFSLV